MRSSVPILFGFIALSLLCTAIAQQISITGSVDVQIVPWGVRLIPVKVQGNVREPVPDVFVQYNLLHVAVVNNTQMISNYSTADFQMRTENSTYMTNGSEVYRVRMYTTFSNNITASVIIERFSNLTIKNYFGWRMDLSDLGAKCSLKFEGLTKNSELNSPDTRISAIVAMTVRLHAYNDAWATLFVTTGDPGTLPLVFSPNAPLNVPLVPNPLRDPTPMSSSLLIRDKAVNMTVTHLDGVSCRDNETAPEKYVGIGFALAWPTPSGQQGDKTAAFDDVLIQMRNTSHLGYAQFVMPAQADMYRERCSLSTDIFEYDPDISIVFGVDPLEPVPTAVARTPEVLQLARDDAEAAKLAGIIVGCIIAVAIAIFILVLVTKPNIRRRFMPLSDYSRQSQRVKTQIKQNDMPPPAAEAAPVAAPPSGRPKSTWVRATVEATE